MKAAVLFIVFNRPSATRLAFEAIRAARPPRLYIAGDGPRAHARGEEALCSLARQIATQVDWPCELRTRFSDTNHGCRGVANSLSWFFNHEEEGIIIEDDVVPLPSFFDYCEELLDRYRHVPEVGLIVGSNYIQRAYSAPQSYFFTSYFHVWGWATWRRTWNLYDGALTSWPAWLAEGGFGEHFSDPKERAYWQQVLQDVYDRKIDTWAYQLMFMCWRLRLLVAYPNVNLVENIGFGDEATHTKGDVPLYVVESPPSPIRFPLTHPPLLAKNDAADREIWRRVYHRSFRVKLRRFLRHWLRVARPHSNKPRMDHSP